MTYSRTISALTALYDPERPTRAILVDALPPGVRVSEFGDWEAEGGRNPWPALVLSAASVVAGPFLGWAAYFVLPG